MDALATVVSGDLVTAPMSGERAAAVVVEALRGDDVVGVMIFGDVLRLRHDGGELDLLARKASWTFTSMFAPPPPLERVPAELVPLLQLGATGFRERLVRSGDRLRVRGEPGGGYRLDEVLAPLRR